MYTNRENKTFFVSKNDEIWKNTCTESLDLNSLGLVESTFIANYYYYCLKSI